ncbi:MAG: substrate-binding domain-containing protein [Actinomycetota bacterium]
MKKQLIILAATMAVLLAVTGTASAQVTKIVTGGSTGLQILASALAAQYGKDSKGKVRVTVSGGGSGAGITGAVNGTFQIGNSSSDLTAAQKGQGAFATPITKEPFAIIVNPANPIKGLTGEQVKQIFLGQITNWKDVGWAQGGAIKCFSRVATSGTRQSFQKLFLGSPTTNVSNSCPALASNALDRSAVANAKGGIAFVTFAYTTGSGGATVKTLPIDGVTPTLQNVVSGTYRYRNGHYFVTKGAPAVDVATYINWVRSAKGAAVIKAYAVPFSGAEAECLS